VSSGIAGRIDPLVRLAPVLPWVVLESGYFWHQFPALECAVFVSPGAVMGQLETDTLTRFVRKESGEIPASRQAGLTP
jgi:hypothetical protein